ncbi:MAG: MBL fold metallo-hydrolase [Planctomycetes bacterium]|nr:MBL fold metallo-hydrolase [Planctomycetota bacterium]
MRRMLVTACFIIGALVSLRSAWAGADNGTLDLYFIDVEGGAATLLVTPQGESVLIDSGYPGNDDRDAKRIHRVATQVADLKRIDHYVTTHWHLDHYGGIAALSKMMPVGDFWDRGIPDKLAEDAEFPKRIALYRETSKGRSKTLKAGDTLPLKTSGDAKRPSVKLQVVVASGEVINPRSQQGLPNPECKQHQPKDPDPTDNAQSLGFLLSFGDFQFLDLGDLTWNVEHKLVCPVNRLGRVDLLMVTHHGLNLSNNPVVAHTVQPRVAVICNGPHKGAHPDVVADLRAVSSLEAVYQLHRNLDSGPEQNTAREFIANMEEKCEGQFVRASVDPAGKSYTLRIGVDGMPREYESR